MARDESENRRSWRPGAKSPFRDSADAGWRRGETSRSVRSASKSRTLRVAGGILGISAVCVTLFWIIRLFQPVSPPIVSIVYASYEDDLATPHNAHGLNAAASLFQSLPIVKAANWWDTRSKVFIEADPFKRLTIRSQPRDFLVGDEKTKNVLLYVTARLGYGGNATSPYLLLPSNPAAPAGSSDLSNRMPLKNLIEAIGKRTAQRYCLILDVTPTASEMPFGMPDLEAIEELGKLEQATEEARNLVILAPGDNRAAAISDEWRQTTFGHFLVEGLKGPAGPTGRINVAGLASWVNDRIHDPTDVSRSNPASPSVLVLGKALARSFDLMLTPEPRRAQEGLDREPTPTDLAEKTRAAWMRHDELANESPHPHSFAPHAWRRFRDKFLRFDDLVRSVDPRPRPKAWKGVDLDPLLEAILADSRSIKNNRTFPLAKSINKTLAMKVALGGGADPREAIDSSRFNQLWESPDDPKSPAIPPEAAADYYQRLIGQVEAATGPDDFDRAARIFAKLTEADYPRPVEAHFLALLLRDRPPHAEDSPLYREAVGNALRVRRLAEWTALGISPSESALPERVAPWIADRMTAADEERRLAEDLLLASDPQRWKEARKKLAGAEEKYLAAAKRARGLWRAMNTRDRALADLPFYSPWAALGPEIKASARGKSVTFDAIVVLESLWADAHALASVLEKGPNSGQVDPIAEESDIQAKAQAVERAFNDVKAAFENAVRERSNDEIRSGDLRAETRNHHAEILAFVATPFLDILTRKRFEDRLADLKGPGQAENSLMPGKTTGNVASRKSRLALAALGQTWFDTPPEAPRPSVVGPAKVSFAKIKLWLEEMSDSTTLSSNRSNYRRAVEQVEQVQDSLVAAIGGLLASGREKRLEDWPTEYLKANHLGRPLLGSRQPVPDPVLMHRRRLVQRLLLAQARRGLGDRYYAELDSPPDPASPHPPEPYFHRLLNAYFDDVMDLKSVVPDGGALLTDMDRIRSEALRENRVEIRKPGAPLVATDEPAVEVRYRVEATPGGDRPTGSPVLWLVPEGQSAIEIIEPASGARETGPIDSGRSGSGDDSKRRGGPLDGWFRRQVAIGVVAAGARAGEHRRPGPANGSIRVEGRFRGQVLRDSTPIAVHRVPEIIVANDPPPHTASLAVQADPALVDRYGRSEGGALAIVLDCSGSMGLPPNVAAKGPSKFAEATDALEQLLPRLTRGTVVSIWIFGENIGLINGNRPPADDTIRPVLTPTVWPPQDPVQFARVTEAIRGLKGRRPYNKSPIVTTMARAAADFRGVAGFKSMVVLTDGKDTSFEGAAPRPIAPSGEISAKIREVFDKSDIEISIVGFKVAGAEDEIRKQFAAIETLQRPGRFYPAGNASTLALVLNRALRPVLTYSVESFDNLLVHDRVGIGDSSTESLQFRRLNRVVPGGYKLVVDVEGSRSVAKLDIHRGDNLAVRMISDRGRIAFERLIWTEGLLAQFPKEAAGGWLLSALRGQATKEGGFTLQTSLERRLDSGETAIELIAPREVWMELSTVSGQSSLFSQRWSRRFDVPASSWEAKVPDWPTDPATERPKRPILQAWWSPDEAIPTATLVKNADFRAIDQIHDFVVQVDGGPLVVESVTVEPIATNLAQGTRRNVFYLVVRARYPDRKPYWFKPNGFNPAMTEHRFYTTANKYTGIFGPMDESEPDILVNGLRLFSVEQFKKRSSRQEFTAKLLKIPKPTTSDNGPLPIRIEGEPGPLPLPSSTILRRSATRSPRPLVWLGSSPLNREKTPNGRTDGIPCRNRSQILATASGAVVAPRPSAGQDQSASDDHRGGLADAPADWGNFLPVVPARPRLETLPAGGWVIARIRDDPAMDPGPRGPGEPRRLHAHLRAKRPRGFG